MTSDSPLDGYQWVVAIPLTTDALVEVMLEVYQKLGLRSRICLISNDAFSPQGIGLPKKDIIVKESKRE